MAEYGQFLYWVLPQQTGRQEQTRLTPVPGPLGPAEPQGGEGGGLPQGQCGVSCTEVLLHHQVRDSQSAGPANLLHQVGEEEPRLQTVGNSQQNEQW